MATRSPSPNPTRPKTPKSKESTHRTSSVLKGSSNLHSPRSSFEQKENLKSRLPGTSSSKGSKSFMAPTISASSKAIAASPRKKILQEKNEVTTPISVSVSSSLEFHSMKEEVLVKEIGLKSEMGFGCQEVLGGNESKRSGLVPSLDVHPSVPPYDPKTNYLSPRPQFLHYRPNPRIEHYLGREGDLLGVGDGRRLEDSFSPESSEDDVDVLANEKEKESDEEEFDDTEVLTDEKMESEEEEFVDVTVLTDQKEKDSEGEQIATDEKMESEEEEFVDVTVLTDEKEKDSEGEQIATEDEEKEEVNITEPETPKSYKFQSFKRSKLLPLLLALVLACLFVPLSDSPVISSSMLGDQPIGSIPMIHTQFIRIFEDLQLRDYLAAATENVEGLARRLRHLSTKSITYYCVTSHSKDVISSHQAINLTSSAMDMFVDSSGFIFKHEIEVPATMKENAVEELSFTGHELDVVQVVEENDAEFEAEKMEEEATNEMFEIENADTESKETDIVLSEVLKEGDFVVPEAEMVISDEEHETATETTEEDLKQEIGHLSNDIINIEEEARTDSQFLDDFMSRSDFMGVQGDSSDAKEVVELQSQFVNDIMGKSGFVDVQGDSADATSRDPIEPISFDENVLEQGEAYPIPHGPELLKAMNQRTLLGLLLALLIPAAMVAIHYMKQKQTPLATNRNHTAKKVGSVSGSSETYTANLKGNERIIDDSGLLEVSNNWNNAASNDQLLSNERRLRRDSVTSSVSYGSFTTYQRLSAKKGGRDDEVVTPVRRSSRIRNLVTSP